ncbi:MAG: zf-HC2 domain-containing protein [Candidatus Eisenbacteria sp.]|nr:zf-HC2 domain-containing protein [Candidatus Eisenbacteria bacterium]
MACPQRQRALQEYLSGDLPPVAARELEAHLESCADCARDLAAYRRLMAALSELPDAPPVPGLHRDVMAALRPQLVKWRHRRETRTQLVMRRGLSAVLAGAFALSLSVALWGWMGRIGSVATARFSRDLVGLWKSAQELWQLVRLFGDVLRTLEPAALGLWEALRSSAAPLVPWGPLILASYAAVAVLGGWLCWRAFHALKEGDLSHAS